jgi:hypothetical protein
MDRRRILLFGASELGRMTLQSWNWEYGHIHYYVDNDSVKWGQNFTGLQVHGPQVLDEENHDELFIIITSIYYNEIANQLESMGMVEGVNFASVEQALMLLSRKKTVFNEKEILAFFLPLHWFGLNHINIKEKCEQENIKCFYAPPRRESMRISLSLDFENYRDIKHRGVPLYLCCKYDVCVKLRVPLNVLSHENNFHWEEITSQMGIAAAYTDHIGDLLDVLKPDIVIIPQGHTLESSVIRFLAIIRGYNVVSIENSFNSKKLIWDNICGIAVNKLVARNYYWRYEDLIDQCQASQYADNYLDSIKSFKADQHISPTRAIELMSKDKKTILFLANVLTDASIMFNSWGITQINAIKAAATLAIKNNYKFILKIHPRERPQYSTNYENLTISALKADRKFWREITSTNNCLIDDDNSFDTYSLIRRSDVCITISSQAGLEALLLGKETILLGNAYYGGLGFTRELINENQLESAVSEALDPARKIVDKDKVEKFFFIFDNLFSVEKNEFGIIEIISRVLRRNKFPAVENLLGA